MATGTQSSDTGVPDQGLYSAQPVFTVDGEKQPALADALIELEVFDDTDGMMRVEARFENWGHPPGGGGDSDFMFFDGGVIAFGKKLQIDVGPKDASQTVFTGRITQIGARFGLSTVPEISVSAEDALQLLRMTRRTRTYEDVSDADVAGTLASAHQLQADADAPGPTHKVLVQLGQTDLAFLRERARAIDAQLWIDNGTLKFKARSARDGGDITLTRGSTLTRFSVIADLTHQVATVKAHGYDVGGKDDPGEDAASSLLSSEARGAKLGADVMQQAFGARTEHVVDRALASNDEARSYAEAELKRRGRAFVRCRGETEGTAALKIGSRLAIGGVGPVFTGTYVATQVRHRYDRAHGFRTLFEAERPAIGEES
jgi:phage protein D